MSLCQLLPSMYEGESRESKFNRLLFCSPLEIVGGGMSMIGDTKVHVRCGRTYGHTKFGNADRFVSTEITVCDTGIKYRQPFYRRRKRLNFIPLDMAWFPCGYIFTPEILSERDMQGIAPGTITDLQWDPIKHKWSIHCCQPKRIHYAEVLKTLFIERLVNA